MYLKKTKKTGRFPQLSSFTLDNYKTLQVADMKQLFVMMPWPCSEVANRTCKFAAVAKRK